MMSIGVSRWRIGVGALAVGLSLWHSRGESVTLPPVADTSLWEQTPTSNLGKSWLAAGTINTTRRSRALVQFDLTAIPGNAVVSAVTVGFRVVRSPSGAMPSTFDLRRVLQPWSEGAQGAPVLRNNGGRAAAGEATWISRGPADWSTAGGEVGTDFAAEPSATGVFTGLALTFASSPGLIADVQAWLQDPARNFGWALVAQSEATVRTARRFGSRETANQEPTLVIEYTVSGLPTAPLLTNPTRVGDRFRFQFTAEANHAYTVEMAADPVVGPWQVFTNYPAATGSQTLDVEDVLDGLGRFYRVRSP